MEVVEKHRSSPLIRVDRPRTGDVPQMRRLIAEEAATNELLPVSDEELYEGLRDFFVARTSDGKPVGTAAIHVYTWELAEVRSYVVSTPWRGHGVGRLLLEAVIAEARSVGVKKLFAMTRKPDLFSRFGFVRVDQQSLPHKVWKDCLKCPKLLDCDEIAVQLELT